MADADLEPIDGVDVETYARVCAVLAAHQDPPMSTTDFGKLLAEHGIAPGDWPRISEAWNARVLHDPDVSARYQHAFQEK